MNSPPAPVPHAAPRRHAGWALVAALALVALTARLGWWQLDRAAGKQVLQARIESQAAAPALPADALPTTDDEVNAALHRRIELRGRWLVEHTVYLENRQMNGRPGFFVLTPLVLAGGDAVLVQRGWLPRDVTDRTRLAPYDTPRDDNVQVLGRIAHWPSRLASLGEDAQGPIRQNLDFSGYSAQVPHTLRPLAVTELATAGRTPDGLMRDWPQPAVGVHKHHGYAAQWFALSALTAGLYVWFQLIRPRRRAGDAHVA